MELPEDVDRYIRIEHSIGLVVNHIVCPHIFMVLSAADSITYIICEIGGVKQFSGAHSKWYRIVEKVGVSVFTVCIYMSYTEIVLFFVKFFIINYFYIKY